MRGFQYCKKKKKIKLSRTHLWTPTQTLKITALDPIERIKKKKKQRKSTWSPWTSVETPTATTTNTTTLRLWQVIASPRRGRDRSHMRAPADTYVTVLAALLARWLKRRRKEDGKHVSAPGTLVKATFIFLIIFLKHQRWDCALKDLHVKGRHGSQSPSVCLYFGVFFFWNTLFWFLLFL